MFKKLICLVTIAVCLLPIVALAQNYDASKVYFDEIPWRDIVFKAGDKFTGGSRISVELYYADAEGNVIERANSTVKSVVIDGEKVSEWRLVETGGAVIQLGNMIYQGAFGYTLKPSYAVADDEGYFSLMENTYRLYSENAIDKKVKFTGTVIGKEADCLLLSIAEEKIVAIKVETPFETDDRLQCKGTITEYVEYQETLIPLITCDQAELRLYEPLQKGDKGEEVIEMKERLRELGYFRAGAELSDSYNDTCAERVQLFQKNNGLPATGTADVETLTLLYSDQAKAN